ncbi:MAG: hypothetical protein WC637_12955, partial [Victivallales bacterium]
YGGKDPEASSSENAYREVCAKNGKVVFKNIPDANHNFYSVAWKQELIEQILEWLKVNFSKEIIDSSGLE